MNDYGRLIFYCLLGAAFLALPLPAEAQRCDRGDAKPLLGIGKFHCQGGVCRVQGAVARSAGARPPSEREGRRFSYDFSVEPSLWDIDPSGPAAGKLEEGDVLVGVNGYAITSVRASEELERLEPGEPVQLMVRRAAHLLEIGVTPALSCEPVWVSAGAEPRPSAERYAVAGRDPSAAEAGRARRGPEEQSGPGTLGVAIACGECVLILPSGDEPAHFSFGEYPTVDSVLESGPADLAGLARGDVLTHIDGADLLTEEGGDRLSRLRIGDSVEIRYLRDGRARTVTVQLVPISWSYSCCGGPGDAQ